MASIVDLLSQQANLRDRPLDPEDPEEEEEQQPLRSPFNLSGTPGERQRKEQSISEAFAGLRDAFTPRARGRTSPIASMASGRGDLGDLMAASDDPAFQELLEQGEYTREDLQRILSDRAPETSRGDVMGGPMEAPTARDATGLPEPGALPEDQDSGDLFTGNIGPVEEFVNRVANFVQERNQSFAEATEGVKGGPHPLLELLGPELGGAGAAMAALPPVTRGFRRGGTGGMVNPANEVGFWRRLLGDEIPAREVGQALRLEQRPEAVLSGTEFARKARQSGESGLANALETPRGRAAVFVRAAEAGETLPQASRSADRVAVETLLEDILGFSGEVRRP